MERFREKARNRPASCSSLRSRPPQEERVSSTITRDSRPEGTSERSMLVQPLPPPRNEHWQLTSVDRRRQCEAVAPESRLTKLSSRRRDSRSRCCSSAANTGAHRTSSPPKPVGTRGRTRPRLPPKQRERQRRAFPSTQRSGVSRLLSKVGRAGRTGRAFDWEMGGDARRSGTSRSLVGPPRATRAKQRSSPTR